MEGEIVHLSFSLVLSGLILRSAVRRVSKEKAGPLILRDAGFAGSSG
jgi:hypothetical protein